MFTVIMEKFLNIFLIQDSKDLTLMNTFVKKEKLKESNTKCVAIVNGMMFRGCIATPSRVEVINCDDFDLLNLIPMISSVLMRHAGIGKILGKH